MLARYLLSVLVAGAAASPVERAHHQRRQSVPFGSVINSCTVSGTVALAFDDGPYIYTEQVLDSLAAAGVKATFFVNGQNFAAIADYASTVQRMVNEGHQVASHTWSHPDLALLGAADISWQMTTLEASLTTIIGKFPTYMRPPYFSTNALVLQTMSDLGYHVVEADIDTQDWANDAPDAIQTSVTLFNQGLSAGGTIVLAHDVHAETASVLVPAMIAAIQAAGLKGVPVGECLGDAEANWYRTSR